MKNKFLIIGLSSSILFTSCIGSFSAFNGIKDWNQSVTDNKFGNELIFLALWIIPVYQIAAFGDLVVFNTIEFWDGTNPIAMNEGEKETKVVKGKKSTYAVTATKNKFHIEIIEGKHKGSITELAYETSDKSWNLIKKEGKKIKLTSLKKGIQMVHMPNGSSFEIYDNMNKNVAKDYISNRAEVK